MSHSHKNIEGGSLSAISRALLRSLNIIRAGRSAFILVAHGPKRQSPTEKPHPGEMFWPEFPFPDLQPGLCRAFLPLPRDPDSSESREANTNTHTCVTVIDPDKGLGFLSQYPEQGGEKKKK